MRAPTPAPIFPVGSLVIYESCPYKRYAQHLFAVLGEVKPDAAGRAQTTIQALCRRISYSTPDLFMVPQVVLAAALTPIEHYGRRVEIGVYAGSGAVRVKLYGDAGLPHLAMLPWSEAPFNPVYDETAIDDAFLARIVGDHYRRAEQRRAA